MIVPAAVDVIVVPAVSVAVLAEDYVRAQRGRGILRHEVDAALDGAVLRVFGAGTVMHDAEVHAALAGAVAQGKRIRAVSQCEGGGLAPGHYAAGAALWAAGVENGGLETPEAALVKLWLAGGRS